MHNRRKLRHTTHPWKRATQLRRDRKSPRFGASGRERGKEDKHCAEKCVRRGCPTRAMYGKGAKELARRPDKLSRLQLPP